MRLLDIDVIGYISPGCPLWFGTDSVRSKVFGM